MPPFQGSQSGPPPLPPGMGGAAAQQPAPPSMMQLAGMQAGQPQGAGAGVSQVSDAVVRMGAEIDQALKTLAQAMPMLAPWVEQTCMQLRAQIGSALQQGAVPTNPEPMDNAQFPDGGGRL
jgi:hypothetical protein